MARAKWRLPLLALALLAIVAIALVPTEQAAAQTPPKVFFSNIGLSAVVDTVEGPGTDTLYISTSATISQNLTVNITLGGTATCGTDYTIASANCAQNTGTFTIPGGTAGFTETPVLDVTFPSDAAAEGKETLVVTIVGGTGYTLGNPAAMTINIHEDSGSAQFTVSGTTVVGGSLTASKVCNDPDGNPSAFTSNIFTVATPRTLETEWTYPTDANISSAKSYSPKQDDQGKFLAFEFEYSDGKGRLTKKRSPMVGPVGAPSSNNTIQFDSASYSSYEGYNLRPTLTFSSATSAEQTFGIHLLNCSALMGVDVTAQVGSSRAAYDGAISVTVPAGVTSHTFDIPLVKDNVAESDENFIIGFNFMPAGFTIGSQNYAEGQVLDDTGMSFLGIRHFVYDGSHWRARDRMAEGNSATKAKVASITIDLNPTHSAHTAFYLCVSDDTNALFRDDVTDWDYRMTADFDVINSQGSVSEVDDSSVTRLNLNEDNCHYYTIPPDYDQSFVFLSVNGDTYQEADETVRFELRRANTTPSNVAIPPDIGVSDFTIENDDGTAPVVTIAGGSDITEGQKASFTLNSTINLPTGQGRHVYVDTGDDVASAFHSGSTFRKWWFGAGSTSHTYSVVQTQDDSVAEDDGKVRATIRPGDGYVVGDPSTATVNVADNDGGVANARIGLTQASYEAMEGANAKVEVELSRARGEDTDFSILAQRIDHSADWDDFGAGTPKEEINLFDYKKFDGTIPAGDTRAVVEIPVTADADDDHGEKFAVYVSHDASVNASAKWNGQVIIKEPAVYELAHDFYNVKEGGSGSITITRSKGLDNPDSSDVTLTFTPGTATAGTDFTPDAATRVVTVDPNTNIGTVSIIGQADGLIEGPERFTVELTAIPEEVAGNSASAGLGSVTEATVQIVDVNLVTADWSLTPSGLGDGDQFRLIFITGSKHKATSSDIATYDATVRNKAAGGHADIQAYAQGFQMLGSTATTNARLHTATGNTDSGQGWDTSTYWLNGGRIATGHDGLWGGEWEHRTRMAGHLRTQSGASDTTAWELWTGTQKSTSSQTGGVKASGNALGDANATFGRFGTNNVIQQGTRVNTGDRRLLGISQVFEVTTKPTITMDIANPTVTEGDDLEITVNSTPAPENPLTVTINLEQKGAVFADAFIFKDYTVTIPANDSSATLTLTTLYDSADEYDGSLIVSIKESADYIVVGAPQTVTVKDDDATAINLSVSRQWMNESGSDNSVDVTISLDRDTGPDETVIIPIRVDAGYAVAGTDYTVSLKSGAQLLTNGEGTHPRHMNHVIVPYSAQNPAVQFTPGTRRAVLTFTAVNNSAKNASDPVLEFDWGFTNDHSDELGLGGGQLSKSPLYTGPGIGNTTSVAIIDDDNTDPVKVSFSLDAYRVYEPNGPGVSPVVKLSRATSQDLTFQVNVTAGTATKGVDYANIDNVQFMIAAGRERVTDTISIFDDSDWEVDETFTLSIDGASLPAGFILGDHPTATVTIEDDETRQNVGVTENLTIKNLAAQATEGSSGASRVGMTLDIMPATSAAGSVSICLSGTATEGVDYRFRTNGQSYRAPDGMGCVTASLGTGGSSAHYLEILNDSVKEPDETVILTPRKNANTVSTVGVPQTPTTLTIVDDDDPAATFATASQTVQEGDGSVNVRVSMTPLAPDQPTSVNYQVVGMGGAQSGSDYTAPSGSVQVPGGVTSVNIPINIINDNAPEFPETIMVKLSSGSGYQLGQQQKHQIEVQDNDAGFLVGLTQDLATNSNAPCAANPQCIVEGKSRVFYIQNRGYDHNRYSVMLSLSASGSAQWGSDYTIQGDFGYGWKTIPPNNRQWGRGIFAVELLDKPLKLRVNARLDNHAEGNETITIGFDPDITLIDIGMGGFADASQVTAHGTVTFTLSEGQPTVSISGGPSAAESEAAEFTLKSNSPVASDLTVNVIVAQQGNFGVATGRQAGVIKQGQSTGVFRVALDDDQVIENDGSVTVTVEDGTGYMVLPNQKTATVDVRDNDSSVIGISGGGEITEGGNATFTLTATPALGQDLSVYVNVGQQGDYVDGTQLGRKTWTIQAGQSSVAFTVPTVNDSAPEAKGAVTASLASDSSYNIKSGKGSARVVVADDELPVISVAAGDQVEEGDIAEFTVSVFPTQQSNLTVSLNVTQQGGVAAQAHRGQKQVAIPAGSAQVSYTVPTVADTVLEPTGSITVAVRSGSTYAVSTAAGSATLVVSDSEIITVSVSGGSNIIEGGSASFTITTSPAAVEPLDVSVSISQATYNTRRIEGVLLWTSDFVDPNGAYKLEDYTITIPTGGSATVDVGTVNDDDWDYPGKVIATLNAGIGYQVSSSDGTAHVNVLDSEPCWYSHTHIPAHLYPSYGDPRVGTPYANVGPCRRISDIEKIEAYPGKGPWVTVWTTCQVGSHYDETNAQGHSHTDPSGHSHDSHYTYSDYQVFGNGFCDVPRAQLQTRLDAKSQDEQTGNTFPDPGAITFSGVTESGMTLTWPQREVDHYLIYWGEAVDGGGLQSVKVATGTLTYTISGLKADTKYAVIVYSQDYDEVTPTAYQRTAATSCTPNLPSDAITVSEVKTWRGEYSQDSHVSRWNRVLAALGEDTGEAAMTADQAREIKSRIDNTRWDRTVRTLEALEQCNNPPPATPEVSITAGSGITEGVTARRGDVTATPAELGRASRNAETTAALVGQRCQRSVVGQRACPRPATLG